jgi:hypothetical protein
LGINTQLFGLEGWNFCRQAFSQFPNGLHFGPNRQLKQGWAAQALDASAGDIFAVEMKSLGRRELGQEQIVTIWRFLEPDGDLHTIFSEMRQFERGGRRASCAEQYQQSKYHPNGGQAKGKN